MAKFFFTAVSNTAQKKIVGSLSGEDEKVARRELNRIGLALLTFSEKQPENWEGAFEFEAEGKNNENIVGEILAKDPEDAFDQLSALDFKKLDYLCRSDATDAEKATAREESIARIVVGKKTNAEEKQEAEKRTLVGGLKSILGGGGKKKNAQEEIWKKYSTDKFEKKLVPKDLPPDEDEETMREKLATAPKPEIEESNVKYRVKTAEEIEAEKNAATEDEPTEKEEAASSAEVAEQTDDENYEYEEEDIEDEKAFEKVKIPFGDQLKKILTGAKTKFNRFYFLLTEIIVPPKDKTRKDGWGDMKAFLFPKKEEKVVDKNSLNYQLSAFFERFWVAVEEIVDVLAAVFLAYFLLGVASLFAEIPMISELAEQTLRGNYLIPFITAAFIFTRILMFLRDKLTRANPIRTLLLLLVGGAVIFVAGVNLL